MIIGQGESNAVCADVSIANLVGLAKEADARDSLDEAITLLKRALHIAQDAYGDDSLSVATIAWEMSSLLEKMGRAEEAGESYSVVRRILGIYRKSHFRKLQFN